ncbi:MAG: alanine/ornithine racemase family PLP-dependent enzyme [Bacteroidetes bacterium]|nr:MAG: alanine/ornithine racemase family PLP-dependent enzyme [Bacteroidota bacterium]
MAFINMSREKLRHNYLFLDNLFKMNHIEWGVVSKVLCGNKLFLSELIDLGAREIHDSRISNLKVIKEINPEVQTVYIKPPARRAISSLVRYADVSFNTQLETIQLISDEAHRQGKIHMIIIMIEMGDLREGILGENLVDFYSKVFKLPNIRVIGIGTNLNCLSGVMPSHDKLIQLSLYKQLINATFNKQINWASGGSSVTIPLLQKKLVPKGNNHFRVGETLFLGNNLVTGSPIKGMKGDVFKLNAEIIELLEKPMVPLGETGTNVAGEMVEINERDYGKISCRAILDLGLLDIDPKNIIPEDKALKIIGVSSDMIVLDLGKNRKHYRVGDLVSFRLNYMGVLSILNSNYIGKIVIQ